MSKPKRITFIVIKHPQRPNTVFERFKIKVWNFILPPQIRLFAHEVVEEGRDHE